MGALTNAAGPVPEVSSFINVKDQPYGAHGNWDGTNGTDDTAAIQVAIAVGEANYPYPYIVTPNVAGTGATITAGVNYK